MTLNLSIDIPQEAVQALESCAASQGEDLATLAKHALIEYLTTMRQTPTVPANTNSLEIQPLPEDIGERTKLAHALLEQYKRRQGHIVPRPIEPPGISDRWPPGESVQDFLRTIQEHNEACQPRVFP